MVDRLQRVRDLAKRSDDGLLVTRERRLVAIDGSLAFSLERAAIEDRRGQPRGEPQSAAPPLPEAAWASDAESCMRG